MWNRSNWLEKERKQEDGEKERKMADSTRSDPGAEGGVDGENV